MTAVDVNHSAPARLLAASVAGADVTALVADAAPHALAAYEALRTFVESEHGQAVEAYWLAFDRLGSRPDWVHDAAAEIPNDVDLILHGIVDLLDQVSPIYVESGTPTERTIAELDELLARLRGAA